MFFEDKAQYIKQGEKQMLYKARNSVIEFFESLLLNDSGAKYQTIHKEEAKILTHKQVVQKQVIHLENY